MLVAILIALLAIILFGVGFAIHVLWWVAIALAVVWLLGFLVRAGEGRRWYRW